MRNSENPLDGSAVHPESYTIVNRFAKRSRLQYQGAHDRQRAPSETRS
ncbi:MAG: hypothetical protein WDO15_26170 [Bacteroidota bacterium]